MPKKCEYKSDKERYEPFSLGNRVGVDQVPLELNQRDFTKNEDNYTYLYKITVQCNFIANFLERNGEK